MTTQEKTIDEQIKELQEQICKEPETTEEQTSNLPVQSCPLSDRIDEQIKDLKDSLLNDRIKESNKKQEKKLLIQIDNKETIIDFLTEQLEIAKKEKDELEEKLECLRYK